MEDKELIEENEQLKKALCICLNEPLVKRLSNAVERINSGEFISEEEFFKDSPILTH